MALVTVHSELRRNRDFAWRRPLHGRRGGGGAPSGGGGVGGKDLSNENRCQRYIRTPPLAASLSPSCRVHLSPPPGRRARWRARSLSLRPDESSTSWSKAVTQGLNSESRNYQDRDPPTQYSNLYTHLEAPALPLGKYPWGRGGAPEERARWRWAPSSWLQCGLDQHAPGTSGPR